MFPLERSSPSLGSPSLTHSTPVYGCLKNGTLPTFRELKNKTIKNTAVVSMAPKEEIPLVNGEFNTSSSLSLVNPESSLPLITNLEPMPMPMLEVLSPDKDSQSCGITPDSHNKHDPSAKTLKYTLGKTNNKVSVLIKNAHTRKNIMENIARIKETKIADMKKWLKQHNLLKSGSKCPPDVIKKLYEQSFLCGIIKNNNETTLIENFLNN